MILITIFLFGTVREPLIIWLIVPMAVCGVVAGLLIADLPFGFMSLLGFLSLFGMLIKNAIVLIEEIDIQIESEKNKYQEEKEGLGDIIGKDERTTAENKSLQAHLDL